MQQRTRLALNALRILLIGLAALPISACGRDGGPTGSSARYPVSGSVVVGGKPAVGVEVRLHPINRSNDADAPHPFATTDAAGKFQLRLTAGEEGAPAGQYLVTLSWPTGRAGSDRLGGAFAEPDGSGLTAIVADGPTVLPPFEIGAGGRGPGRHLP